MNFNFDFVKHWKWYFLVSGVILALGLAVLPFFGLNLGVDFQGGTRLDIHVGQAVGQQEMIDFVREHGLEPSTTQLASEGEYVIMRFDEEIGKERLAALRRALQDKYGEEANIQESTVDPTFAKELARKAVIGVLVASVGIAVYVMARFEYRFAVAALISLLHDALMVVAFFALFRIEVDLTFIVAVLTVVGYSINDTIVIFDRIRENMKTYKLKMAEDYRRLVNDSIRQTLARSVNTLLTVIFVAVALLVFGPNSIRNFSLAMLIGLVSGGYSSLFIASQLWYLWRVRDLRKRKIAAAS